MPKPEPPSMNLQPPQDPMPGPEPPEFLRLREEATPDNAEACYALGSALLARNAASEEALGWFARAAAKEHPGGHYHMALHCRSHNEKGMAEYHIHAAAAGGYQAAVTALKDWRVSGYIDFDDDGEAVELLAEAAEAGSNEARYQLAVRLTKGQGAAEDPPRVAKLYLQAAEAGYVPAMHGLGTCYHRGYGIGHDGEKARYWLSKAASTDYPDSWYGLAVVHRERGEYEEALKCFQKAAALGHTDALFSLAQVHGRGEGVPEDQDMMRSLTAEAAEKGHVEAQYWLGTYYRYCEGTFPQDLEKAVYWFERASCADHPNAIYCLGLHTLLGKGVEQDIRKGWDLFEKAARMGVVDAMLALATMIDSGEGYIVDPAAALDWYQKAADKGSVDAQVIAGKRMLEIPNERRYARQYLEMAAKQGNEEARTLLKTFPEEKPAVPEPSAVLAAAIAGDAQSQYQLGFGHFMGIGATRSFPLSYFWFSVLSRTMPPQAAAMLQALDGQLATDVRESIDKQVEAWQTGMPPPEL
jgi:TPR repeat protein